jgi:uncharacterized repeat protein (TIGR03803 family)
LALSGNTLYGTALKGGYSALGTVFGIHTDGSGFTNLYNFTGGTNDGSYPAAGLLVSGGALYGTMGSGGSAKNGCVFALSTNGTVFGFTNLYSFTALYASTNRDGADPAAGLSLANNTLYGTASIGGRTGWGTVFALHLDHLTFTNLYSFTTAAGSSPATNRDGTQPKASLVLAGSSLYGTAYAGGSAGNGTVFRLALSPALSSPRLSLATASTNAILSWPTNEAGFTLQSTTNLGTAVWSAVTTAPVVVTGQNTVTNPMVRAQQYYRLIQ